MTEHKDRNFVGWRAPLDKNKKQTRNPYFNVDGDISRYQIADRKKGSSRKKCTSESPKS